MIGRKIQHYRITRELGSGGMGVVYLADDTELGRNVALKFLPQGSASNEAAIERFKREARAAAALDHPNICPIYELGHYENQLFTAMAYVEGRTFREVIEERPVELSAVIDWSRQVAAGLNHAHTHGVVHRDIKPENLAVTGEGVVRILDFGLARVAGEMTVTAKGATLGTLPYMSPEQLRADKVDHRTDIWSLGVVMYEMVTGRRPFDGVREAMSYGIINQDPEPVTALRTGIPLELERIILKALSKEPSHRYQHADEMAADLDAMVSGVHESERIAAPRKRRAWLVVAGVVIAAAAVAYFARPTPSLPFHGRDWILITEFANHTGEERFDEMVSQALAIDLNQSQYVNVFSGTRLRDAMRRMEREDAESIDAELGRELCVREGIPVMVAGSVDRLGSGYRVSVELIVSSTGDAARTERVDAGSAEELFTAVDDLSRRVRRHLGESLANIEERDEPLADATTGSLEALRYFTVAQRHIVRADNEGAMPFLHKALEADSTFASAWAMMALAHHNLGEVRSARDISRQSWKYRGRVTERERLYIEAEYFRYRSAYTQAAEKFVLLTELYPDDFAGHNNLAFLCQYTREYERALDSIKEAGRVRPNAWHVSQNMGLVFAGLSEWDSAMVHLERGLAISPNAHWSEISVAYVKACQGDLDGAVEWILRLPEDGATWEYYRTAVRANILLFTGNEPRAVDLLEEELNYGMGASGGWHEASLRAAIITHLVYLERYAEAIAQTAPDNIRDNSYAQRWLVSAYARSGDIDAAEVALEQLRLLSAEDEIYPERSLVPYAEGEIALARGDPSAAARHFRASLALNDDLITRERLAVTYRALGETDLALAEYAEIIQYPYATFFDGNPFVWPQALLGRADLHMQLGNREAAERDMALLAAVQTRGASDGYARTRMRATLAR